MACKFLKYGCHGASVVCRTATKDFINPIEKREKCPNVKNPYVITRLCFEVDI